MQMATDRKQSAAEAETMKGEITALKAELEKEKERTALLEARVIGMLEQYGVKKEGVDMSEREQFLELEKERDAFERFFERNWGVAKRKIRKKLLWRKGK